MHHACIYMCNSNRIHMVSALYFKFTVKFLSMYVHGALPTFTSHIEMNSELIIWHHLIHDGDVTGPKLDWFVTSEKSRECQ